MITLRWIGEKRKITPFIRDTFNSHGNTLLNGLVYGWLKSRYNEITEISLYYI